MTPAETARILGILTTTRLGSKTEPTRANVAGWHAALEDLPFEPVRRAALRWVRHNRYLPVPYEIRLLVAEELGLATPEQAWDRIVGSVLRHEPGITLTDAEIEGLRSVGGTWELRQSEHPERLRDRFMRVYEPLMWTAFDQTVAALPPGSSGGDDVVVKELAG